ncbi:uncharacterized protein [Medicago truncatula]|uniref:uncharacterized protein isoform X2 n=1 Tax=Medicago truncatula TaxID=3880 RepID=UPI000D2F26C7|nr:uncharacterized protein LOC11417887 isoform X2 [Medicago truncatula]
MSFSDDGSDSFGYTVHQMLLSNKLLNHTDSNNSDRQPFSFALSSKDKNWSENERDTSDFNSGLANQMNVLSEQLQHEGSDIDLESLRLEEDIDLNSLSREAVVELYTRPKNGAIYDEVWGTIKERLKFLSKSDENLSIDEAIEIYDASVLMKFLKKDKDEIELAGRMAYRGALMMLQAEILSKKGRELLAQSKLKLQMADL